MQFKIDSGKRLQNIYFTEHQHSPFQNYVQESMQVMRGLHKLILSTEKMVVTANRDVHW